MLRLLVADSEWMAGLASMLDDIYTISINGQVHQQSKTRNGLHDSPEVVLRRGNSTSTSL